MFNQIIPVSLIVLLSACSTNQTPPYQKNKNPEDRTQYSGTEGLMQMQKDKIYIMNKELSDKCTTAKINLAIAETDSNTDEIKKQQTIITDTCI